MVAAVDVKNPLEVRRAGLRVLTEHLGSEVTGAFLRQSVCRTGDMVAEKYEGPDQTMEELAEEMRRITKTERARRLYDN